MAMVSPPGSAARPLCVFDLDHTILHMLKDSDLPTDVEDVSEDVVWFEWDGVRYGIALRVGTTALVTALKKKEIDIAVATCNLLGHQVRRPLPLKGDPPPPFLK